MKNYKKRLALLILFVFGISGAVIYFTIDIHTLKNLALFKSWSILLALATVTLGLFLDGSRLMHLVHLSGEDISFYEAVQVVFGNYFLAMLFPGAAGGAVAQLMFLRRAGVPTGKATVLVFVRTILSILFLFVCLPFVFVHDRTILPKNLNQFFFVFFVTIILLVILVLSGLHQKLFANLSVYIAKRLSPHRRQQFISIYRSAHSAVKMLIASPIKMLLIFLESGLSLLAIYAIVPSLMLGLGIDLTEINWYCVMGRMIFLNLLLYFTPTPGGSGIAEGGFIFLFSEFLPAGTVGIMAVSWRLIAEYIPFALGFYYMVKVFGRDFLRRELK